MAKGPRSTEIPKEEAPIDNRVSVRLDRLDRSVEHLDTSFKAVKETNSLIVIVLFVGFMGLLVAIFLAGIGALHSNVDSNNELNSTMQELIQLQTTKNTTTPSSTPTPKNK